MQLRHINWVYVFTLSLITATVCEEISLGKDDANDTQADAKNTSQIEGQKDTPPQGDINSTRKSDGTLDDENNGQLTHLLHDAKGEFCTCDLRPFVCDINCCCDTKCSAAEKRLFSSCITVTDPLHDHSPKSCYSKNLFAYSSLLSGVTEKESSSVRSTLLCVEWSNVKKKSFYPNRRAITSANEIAKIERPEKYTWMSKHDASSSQDTPNEALLYLREGDAMRLITRHSPHWYTWTLPSSIFSPSGTGLCDSKQPIRYLRWSSTSCLRYIQSLQTDCSTFLNKSFYINFMIDKRLPAFNSHPLASSLSEAVDDVLKQTSVTRNEIETGDSSKTKGLLYSSSSSSCLKDATCVPLTVVSNSSPTLFVSTNDAASQVGKVKATCADAVRKVAYQVHFKASTDRTQASIDKINVILDTINITGARGYFRQFFDVKFIQVIPSNDTSSRDTEKMNVDKSTFRLSGNPGYQMNEAILATRIVNRGESDKNDTLASHDAESEESSFSYQQLLLPMLSSNLDNTCPPSLTSNVHDKYITIKFGVNVMTSCFFNMSSVNEKSDVSERRNSLFNFASTKIPQRLLDDDDAGICHKIQSRLFTSIDLNGKILNVTHVGMFGNSNSSHMSDWLPIVNVYQGTRTSLTGSLSTLPSLSSSPHDQKTSIEIPPLTPSGVCPLLITGISYEIFHTKVGPVDQPQVKLISIVRTFTTTSNVAPYTSNIASSVPRIRVTGTVTFYDVTQGVRSKFAPPPVLTIQLPADFFYPFLLVHSSSILQVTHYPYLTVFSIIFSTLVSTIHRNV